MLMAKQEKILKRFDAPDEVRVFNKSTFERIRMGSGKYDDRPRHLPAGMEVVR
jgi:hypothetical protein